MAFNKITDDLNVIQALDDEPNDVGGLTAQQLKAKFDEAGNKLKTRFNAFIDQITATSAAGNIGFSATTGVPESNVQDAIENVQAQIVEVTQDGVADNSITTAKIYDAAVTADKLHSGAVTTEKIYDDAVTSDKIADNAVKGEHVAKNTLRTDFNGTDALTVAEITNSSTATLNLKMHYVRALGIVFFEGSTKFKPLSAGSAIALYLFDHYAPSGTNWGTAFGTNINSHADFGYDTVSNKVSMTVIRTNIPSESVGNDLYAYFSGWYFCEGA